MEVLIIIRSQKGKRSYDLYVTAEISDGGYNEFHIINGNTVDLYYCRNLQIDKRSHKDWKKAFDIHPSKYGFLIEFKKPIKSFRAWQNLKVNMIGFESSDV